MLGRPCFLVFTLYGFVLGTLWGWTGRAAAHGDYHEVVKEVEEALKRQPEDSELHFRLALASQEHGEWAVAMEASERAERLAPGKHPVALVQGMALATGGHPKAAEARLNAFLLQFPGHSKALQERAQVRVTMNRLAEAADDYEAALANNRQSDPETYLEAAAARVRLGDRPRAASLLKEGIKRLGNHPELLNRAVDLAAEQGETTTAIGYLDALQSVSPRPEECLARKARMLTQAGDTPAARQAWDHFCRHVEGLPNLQRGQPHISLLWEEALTALGGCPSPPPVQASPAPPNRTSGAP